MKNWLLIFICILAQEVVYAQNIIIKDINIITMTTNTLFEKQSVLIQDGIIKQIDKFEKIKKANQDLVIEGQGKFLMPGLADMHVHIPEKEKLDTFFLLNLAAGVTHIRVMNSKIPQEEIKKIAKESRHGAPEIHYSHIIRNDKSYTENQADSLMISVKNQGLDFIKLFSLSSENTFDNLIKSANQHDVIICGHYPTYMQDGQNAMIDIEKVITSNKRVLNIWQDIVGSKMKHY